MDNTKVEITAEMTASIEKLKQKVKLRNQMGGALYYNVLNDECCQLANECAGLGCSRDDISSILGKGTFAN